MALRVQVPYLESQPVSKGNRIWGCCMWLSSCAVTTPGEAIPIDYVWMAPPAGVQPSGGNGVQANVGGKPRPALFALSPCCLTVERLTVWHSSKLCSYHVFSASGLMGISKAYRPCAHSRTAYSISSLKKKIATAVNTENLAFLRKYKKLQN